MGKAPKGPKHPAKKFFTIAAALMAIAAILSFITLFVPWSMKMPNSTAHYSYHLWWNCYWNPQSTTDMVSCQDNVYQVGSGTSFIPVFSDTKARGYFMATQAFAVIGFVWSVLALLLLVVVMSKIWTRPMSMAALAACMVFFAWVFIMLAWIMYLVYAEHPVWGKLPGFPWNTSVGTFTNGSTPVRGYSYGFIISIIAAFFALLASLVACLGLNKLRTWYPVQEPQAPMMEPTYYPPITVPAPTPYYPSVPSYPTAAAPAYPTAGAAAAYPTVPQPYYLPAY
jgi:hypothetical protein